MANNTNTRYESGIEVSRRDKESIGSLMRRFNQRVRSSGVLQAVRSNRVRTSEPNRRARRESALVRAEDRKRYQQMRKLGKVIKKK